MSASGACRPDLFSILATVDQALARLYSAVDALPQGGEMRTAWDDALAADGLSELRQEWSSTHRLCGSFVHTRDYGLACATGDHTPTVASLLVKAVDSFVDSLSRPLPTRIDHRMIEDTAQGAHALLCELVSSSRIQQEAHDRMFAQPLSMPPRMVDCTRFVWVHALLARIKHDRTTAAWFDTLPCLSHYIGMVTTPAVSYEFDDAFGATPATPALCSDAIHLGELWHHAEMADLITPEQQAVLEDPVRAFFEDLLRLAATASVAAVDAARTLDELSLALATSVDALAWAGRQTPVKRGHFAPNQDLAIKQLERCWGAVRVLVQLLDMCDVSTRYMPVRNLRSMALSIVAPIPDLLGELDASEFTVRRVKRRPKTRSAQLVDMLETGQELNRRLCDEHLNRIEEDPLRSGPGTVAETLALLGLALLAVGFELRGHCPGRFAMADCLDVWRTTGAAYLSDGRDRTRGDGRVSAHCWRQVKDEIGHLVSYHKISHAMASSHANAVSPPCSIPLARSTPHEANHGICLSSRLSRSKS